MSIAVFISGTTERRALVEGIVPYIQTVSNGEIIARPWYTEFPSGEFTLESLLRVVNETDAAFIILTPDDTVRSRGRKTRSPRDNLLLEAGLFFASHGRERTFLFVPEVPGSVHSRSNVKHPTDLAGLATNRFSSPHGASFAATGLPEQLRQACEALTKRGPRPRRAIDEFEAIGTLGQIERAITITGPTDILTTQWLLPFIDQATQIDLVNAYRVNDFVRDALAAFRNRRNARLRCCFMDAWDPPLVEVFQRKVTDRSVSQIQETLLTSVQKLLGLPKQPAAGTQFPRITLPRGKDQANIEIFLTSQRLTYTFCRVDDRAFIVPLDMKQRQDPPPRAWAISQMTSPIAFGYYLSDTDQLYREATRVFPSR